MTTKKFWCYYSGNGNTAKRRCIELHPLAELLPRMNIKCKTPLWYEKGEKDPYCSWIDYTIYAQLSDKVAVDIQVNLTDYNIEEALQTDGQIKEKAEDTWRYDMGRATTDDERKEVQEKMERCRLGFVESRERWYKGLTLLSDFDFYLLSQANWISMGMLKAYEDIQSPIFPTLQTLRKGFEQKRDEDDRKRKEQRREEERKREEEEAKRKAEEEAKEYARLTGEAVKCKTGESISGEDVVELCRRYGINVHLRTVHNLQQVVHIINGRDRNCQYYHTRGKRSPKLDGCYTTARQLYDYLQTHDAT